LLYGAFDQQFHANAELKSQLRALATVMNEERYANRMQTLRQADDKLEAKRHALQEHADRVRDTTHTVRAVCEDLRSVLKHYGRFSDDQVDAAMACLKEAELTDKAIRAREELDELAAKREEHKQRQARLDEQAALIKDQEAAIAADYLSLQQDKEARQVVSDSAAWKKLHKSMRTMAKIPPPASLATRYTARFHRQGRGMRCQFGTPLLRSAGVHRVAGALKSDDGSGERMVRCQGSRSSPRTEQSGGQRSERSLGLVRRNTRRAGGPADALTTGHETAQTVKIVGGSELVRIC
jgi:hypothetical protein